MTLPPATYDCDPGLTDSEVVAFCRNGYLLLEGVVPNEINAKVQDYLGEDTYYEPTGILEQNWFVEEVICNDKAIGAIRCLLGHDFHLPVLMSNHRVQGPYNAVGGWHVDGNYRFSPEVQYLQVFYYPQDTPSEIGPTQVVPGTHLIPHKARFMGHLNAIRGVASTAAPAGSIFITVYQIWHRRGPAKAKALRNMLKYVYWRTKPPQRDWIREDDFDLATADFNTPANQFVEQFRGNAKAAEMFLWLCGEHETFQNVGGQSWPTPAHRLDKPYGLPEALSDS
ncbi:MAG: hypothetical protein VX733_09650 [Candidatus Latescibacterota bacterium]|nr:hypothetical protein [Candidatus Latescibacterota bacterium]